MLHNALKSQNLSNKDNCNCSSGSNTTSVPALQTYHYIMAYLRALFSVLYFSLCIQASLIDQFTQSTNTTILLLCTCMPDLLLQYIENRYSDSKSGRLCWWCIQLNIIKEIKVNPMKIECLWVETSRRKHLILHESISIEDVNIATSCSVKL